MSSASTSSGILPKAWAASRVEEARRARGRVAPISRERLNDADFVVGVHHADQARCPGWKAARKLVEVDEAVRAAAGGR